MRRRRCPPARTMLRLTIALALAAMSLPARVARGDQEPVRALIVTGGHDFDPGFWDLFEGRDDIVALRAQHPDAQREFAPDRSERYDVLVLYDLYRPIDEKARKDFVALLESGKGLVVLHHALANYPDWPLYEEIIGGRYLLAERTLPDGTRIPGSTYRHDVEIRVENADPSHPITRGIDDFDMVDEVYGGYLVAGGVHQILRTDHPESAKVIGWTRKHGKARVVVLQSGHGPTAYGHPAYRRLVSRSILWAARRLDAPALDRPWRRLFNRRDFAGWEPAGNARWEVSDGVLVGTQGPGGASGDLFTTEELDDFELEVTYRVTWPANTGIWFRYRSPQEAYQADILEWKDPRCWSGTIYCPGKMFLAMNTDRSTVRREGWNTMRIVARGSRLAVDLNGIRVAECQDDSFSRGRIGFQVHAGDQFSDMKIEVLDVRVRALEDVEEDAMILHEAGARIAAHRAGPLRVHVVTAAGQPIGNASVTVKQVRHEFLFGCNIFAHGKLEPPEDERAYRERFAALLNYATLPFYWRGYEPERDEPEHADRQRVARWCLENAITPKGHPLVWNHPAGVPRWLPSDPVEIRELSEARVRDCVSRFRDLVTIWDVVNEATDPWRFREDNPMTAAMDEFGVTEWTVRSFLAAREANPEAILLINDYRTDRAYEELIERLKHEGEPLYDVIGIQSHQHGGAWAPSRAWQVCETFARFGAPLHFTETTILSGRRQPDRRWGPSEPELEAVQAREVVRFYTTLFSHPAVEAITWWDFADRRAWQGAAAGLLREDLSPKLAYNRLMALIHGAWWTDRTLSTNADGEAVVRAFFGEHEIEVRHAEVGTRLRRAITRDAGELDVTITLPVGAQEARIGRPGR